MDNLILLEKNLNDFLQTLEKEIKLYCCIDKIYYNTTSDLQSPKKINEIIKNIIIGIEDEETEIDSTVIIFKSGEKFNNLIKIIDYLNSIEIKKDKTKIKKIIGSFEKYFMINQEKYFKTRFVFNIKKLTDLKKILK